MTHPRDAEAGTGPGGVDRGVGMKGTERLVRRTGFGSEEKFRAHLEDHREAADGCRHGVEILAAIALDGLKERGLNEHGYSMICGRGGFCKRNDYEVCEGRGIQLEIFFRFYKVRLTD